MWPTCLGIRGRPSGLGQCGTTLLELMIAAVSGLIILSAAWQTLSFLHRQFSLQQFSLARQQDLRLGLAVLEQELHQAEPEAVSTMGHEELEFWANVNSLVTTVNAPALSGQTSIRVDDGRGWQERKTIIISWNDQKEVTVLARDGQRMLLTLTQPLVTAIPAGASVSIRNRVRYYSKQDDLGNKRLLRMVDGGASVLVGDIETTTFSYWGEDGRAVSEPRYLKRIVVEVTLRGLGTKAIREISLKS